MINFFTADITFNLKNKRLLKSWLHETAAKEKNHIASLNVIFCSDEYLYKLNMQYLLHDTFTDIITFGESAQHQINGELYISIDRVKDNSQQLNVTFIAELHRVMVHGLLHLCGYADKTISKKREMSAKEDFYLSLLKFL